ncbi:MAG TPA: UrcA family protein, partial [Steroidobacteraceae bacterium]|nr:UrcA family protein [Steroidobacteraceae bacterium]
APGIAVAGGADRNASEPITVYYGKLDLSKEADANKLYGQLQVAARQICAPLDGRELRRKAAWKACYSETLANAVLQVNREAVTALHQREARPNHAS